MPGEHHAGDCYLEITFPRAYDGIETSPGRIRVPFMNVASARQALREMKTEITHEINIVAGEVLSDPPDIPDEKTLQTIRRRQLEYTDTHGGWMSDAARQELEALRDTGEDNDTAS